jgi:heat shock protein HtpX
VNFRERQAANRRRTAWLIAAHLALFALLGLALDAAFLGFPRRGPGIPVVSTVAVAISALTCVYAYFWGDHAVMFSLLARPLDRNDPEQRELANIVLEMSIAAGLPPPRVFVVPDPAPNALATGRDPRHAVIAVTAGALVLLDREETQGVVAHEMAHIAAGDTMVMTMVSVLFGGLAMLSDWGRRVPLFAGGVHVGALLLAIPVFLLTLVSPLISRLLALTVARQREYLADATAVELTRNPTGLRRALEKIRRTTSPVRGASRGTAHLFIVNPLRRRSDERSTRWADLFSTHPPLAQRIALLGGAQPGA